MTDLAILCALEEELPKDNNPYRDVTFYTGVGKVNAAIKTYEIIKELSPATIINFGTAGSCNHGLNGLVECGTFFDRDGVSQFTGENRIITKPHLPTLSTGDSFVTEGREGCDLVDMEGYAIADICQRNQTNFICVKYVTDYVNNNSLSDWSNNVSSGHALFIEWLNDIVGAKI
tara:strand:+ start:2856 stop:3377 length:522 start_codon:yes stop_codon:yes gene_type:complete